MTKDPGPPPAGLLPPEYFALYIAARNAPKWREQLAVGSHDVDVVLRIDGTFHVGGPQTQTRKRPPELADVLGWMLARMKKASREKCLLELGADFYGGAKPRAVPDEIAAHVLRFLECATAVDTIPKSGNVSGPLTITRMPRPGEPVR